MTNLKDKLQTVTVPTIMDDTLPADCQSKENGVCRLSPGACKQCYPREVQLTGYFFSSEELLELKKQWASEVFDASRDAEAQSWAGIDFKHPDKETYINSLTLD